MLKPARALAAIALVALALAAEATAAPGDPDPTFSGDGFALLDFQKQWETGGGDRRRARRQGRPLRLLGAGDRPRPLPRPPPARRVARHQPGASAASAPTPPTAKAATRSPTSRSWPTGRVLVGGGCDGDFFLARFMPDGNLDTGFDGDPGNPGGGNGVVRTSFPQEVAGFAMAVDPGDGSITVAGPCCTGVPPSVQDSTFARYHADGTLDQGFDGPPANPGGGNGRVIIPLEADDGRPPRRPGRGGGSPGRLRRRKSQKHAGRDHRRRRQTGQAPSRATASPNAASGRSTRRAAR